MALMLAWRRRALRLLISLLGRQSPVVIPVCRAALFLFAVVADVRHPDQRLADERDEARAEILLSAGLCSLEVIRRIVEGRCLLAYAVPFDFFRYGPRISVQVVSKFLKGQSLVQLCLNVLPILCIQMLMLVVGSRVSYDLFSHSRYPPDVWESDIPFMQRACSFSLHD